jgi:hypothetical protein
MLTRAAAAGWLLLLVTAIPAAAEWHFTPMIGRTFAGRTTFVDLELAAPTPHKNFGGAVTLLGGGILGVEGVFVVTPGFFHRTGEFLDSSRTFALMGNAVVTTPRRWTEYGLRPFVSSGFGVMRAFPAEKGSALDVSTPLTGFNVGGGAIGFLTKNVGLRFDLRYYVAVNHPDPGPAVSLGPAHLRYMTASIGLVFRRGAPRVSTR